MFKRTFSYMCRNVEFGRPQSFQGDMIHSSILTTSRERNFYCFSFTFFVLFLSFTFNHPVFIKVFNVSPSRLPIQLFTTVSDIYSQSVAKEIQMGKMQNMKIQMRKKKEMCK